MLYKFILQSFSYNNWDKTLKSNISEQNALDMISCLFYRYIRELKQFHIFIRSIVSAYRICRDGIQIVLQLQVWTILYCYFCLRS